ncbi:MAG: flagellar assembly protein FliW [Verrucomicrobiota bacterium]
MKENPSTLDPPTNLDENEIFLPQGLVGFPNLNRMEILVDEEELPFMWLNSQEEEALSFIVVEPGGLIDNYQAQVSESDAELLGLENGEDAVILNIATISNGPPKRITVNLPGPIVINRNTRVAKQVVIENYEDYSARHLLYEESDEGGEAPC